MDAGPGVSTAIGGDPSRTLLQNSYGVDSKYSVVPGIGDDCSAYISDCQSNGYRPYPSCCIVLSSANFDTSGYDCFFFGGSSGVSCPNDSDHAGCCCA